MYKEMYTREQAFPPGIHFFVKIGKFGVLYFYELAMDSRELQTKFDRIL